ncbi:PREDICTED: pleckstrin homology domain-containing family G member 6 [Cyprinodon variegatus]|uniref:Pleckstrin homology domain containing, family G (with RhoGef domain) member 6 n=1 Tax=Cyprinodon variegatus TaxID=28743 RepID=A0A3Q2DKW6_CYPVA|nr:PREDICTED: pleckstrin homology domain-containing family G member 6 [Cyprinodon variegatus]
MDPTKPSLSPKMPYVNNEGLESVMKEMLQRQNSLNGEKPKDAESRETDFVDGLTTTLEISRRRGSADKNKYSTIGYQRKPRQKVVTDFATLSKGSSSGSKSRTPLKQVFSVVNQGVSEKTSEERGQLDLLVKDLEAFAVPASLKWIWKEESQGTTLENSWTDLVKSHSQMAKKQRHQQAALWEFVQTELIYINKLKIIKDVVIAALVNLNQHDLLQEVTPELLFSNLPSILQAHQLFWQEVVYPMLHEVRTTGKPFDPMRLEAGCLQFHERFSVYHQYCWEEESNLEFTRRQLESNPHFIAFVQWVEKHPQCERMRLGDMQAKPHQRITKYPLLLRAVLKETQEHRVQQALKAMLTTVNSFLESINGFMQLKDEELALSISAERLEGYEVEGINEEVDKVVRDVCRFDLRYPIRGVGPNVVRKLLLEDNLKLRGRKDSKVEVVALLFSDVLLLTKVQKKAERLKVVRPPLALDRTHCDSLKDGYSFVLVEVGELQCMMNVFILVTSTPECCSKWVKNIQSAKEELLSLRKKEDNRLDNVRLHQLESKPAQDIKNDDMEIEEQPLKPLKQRSLMEELNDKINKQSFNGSEEANQNHPSDQLSPNNSGLPPMYPKQGSNTQNSVRKNIPTRQPAFKQEWIEMGTRKGLARKPLEEDGKIVETRLTNNQSTMWKHRGDLVSKSVNHFTPIETAGQGRYNPPRQPRRLIDELPDVDYPTDDETTLQVPHEPIIMSRQQFVRPPVETQILKRSNSDMQLTTQDTRKNSVSSHIGDAETPPDTAGFPQNLKSPGLRKRRPGSTNQGPPTPTSKQFLQEPTQSLAAPSSYLNSDTENSLNPKRNSLPARFNLDPQRGVSPIPQRSTKSKTPNPPLKYSSDIEAFSESELPEMKFQNIKPKFKDFRSSSSPNMLSREGQGPRRPSDSLYTSTKEEERPSSGYNPNEHTSRVEGVLERAKERAKDKGGIKKDKQANATSPKSRYLRPSSPFYNAPSPTPSEGGNETDVEEVALIRPRVLTVSAGWKEQLVDGEEDDKSSSNTPLNGVNVDWTGWCFDDDEVMDHIAPRGEGLLEGISRVLPDWGFIEGQEQDDGEYSQV